MPSPVRSRSSFTIAAVTAISDALVVVFRYCFCRCPDVIDLDELIDAHFATGACLTLSDGVSNGGDVEANRADRVIVTGDYVIDAFRVAIGVDDTDHRNAELVRFRYCDVLVLHIDDEQHVRQAAHLLDATKTALEFRHQPAFRQRFLLGELFERTVLRLRLEFFEATDRLADRFVVGQHSAEPTLIDERHVDARCLFANDFRCRAFRPDEQNLVAACRSGPQMPQRFVEGGHRTLEVDDMDLVASPENVRGHFRIPEPRLMTEVHACGQHVTHADVCHVSSSMFGLSLHAPRIRTIFRWHPRIRVDACEYLV